MHTAINVAIVVVALLHLYFLVLEMFLWTKPLGMRTFRLTPELAQQTAGLAKNQGLYNGFLAAGLLWSVVEGGRAGFHLQLFFLSCVIVAGIFGAVTVNRRIFVVQALPALIALVLVHLH
jgi:putative membrane protein